MDKPDQIRAAATEAGNSKFAVPSVASTGVIPRGQDRYVASLVLWI